MAAQSLMAATAGPMSPKKPHFEPTAKRVIFLFMAGAPSHLEMFDYKPQLAKFDGTLPPPELLVVIAQDVGWELQDVEVIRNRVSKDGNPLCQKLLRLCSQ